MDECEDGGDDGERNYGDSDGGDDRSDDDSVRLSALISRN